MEYPNERKMKNQFLSQFAVHGETERDKWTAEIDKPLVSPFFRKLNGALACCAHFPSRQLLPSSIHPSLSISISLFVYLTLFLMDCLGQFSWTVYVRTSLLPTFWHVNLLIVIRVHHLHKYSNVHQFWRGTQVHPITNYYNTILLYPSSHLIICWLVSQLV